MKILEWQFLLTSHTRANYADHLTASSTCISINSHASKLVHWPNHWQSQSTREDSSAVSLGLEISQLFTHLWASPSFSKSKKKRAPMLAKVQTRVVKSRSPKHDHSIWDSCLKGQTQLHQKFRIVDSSKNGLLVLLPFSWSWLKYWPWKSWSLGVIRKFKKISVLHLSPKKVQRKHWSNLKLLATKHDWWSMMKNAF